MKPKNVFNFVQAISQAGFMKRTHGIKSITCRKAAPLILNKEDHIVVSTDLRWIGCENPSTFRALTGMWKLVLLDETKVKP